MKNKILGIWATVKSILKENTFLVKVVLIALIAIIAIIVVASCLKKTEVGTTAGNINNQGLAIQEGKWIYYADIDNNELFGICRVKENGKKAEKIIDGKYSYLNIIGNNIYCLEESDGAYDLVKIKKDGKNKKVLANDINNSPIIATDKYVYYFNNEHLYKAKLDGTEKTKISDKKISYYQIDNNWIYYIYENENNQYIARMKLDGNKFERISKLERGEYETLYVKDGKIYYIMSEEDEIYDTNYYLYRMNKKGEKIEKICKIDENIRYINMEEDNIYYTITEDYSTYNIYKIEYDGTDKEKIRKMNNVKNLNIVDEWAIFIGVNEDYDEVVKMISIDGKDEKQL